MQLLTAQLRMLLLVEEARVHVPVQSVEGKAVEAARTLAKVATKPATIVAVILEVSGLCS
jgi:hypothetical protein